MWKLYEFRKTDGRRIVNWPLLAVLAVVVHVAMIGGIEVFWYGFTGGFSPLMGGFGLIAAWITLVRIVGEALFGPPPVYGPGSGRS